MSAVDVHADAQAWFEEQMSTAKARHGVNWPAVQDWVRDYLVEELRQREHPDERTVHREHG